MISKVFNFLKFFSKTKVLVANNLFVFYLLSASAVAVSNSFKFTDKIEHNYLYRVQLESPSKLSNDLFLSASSRLENYYKKYSNKSTFVNYEKEQFLSTSSSDEKSKNDFNFFVHQKSDKKIIDLNKHWLSTVKLNQLNIDRYGVASYKADGTASDENSDTKIVPVVDWNSVDLNSFLLKKSEHGHDIISFDINKEIPQSELQIFANADAAKYQALNADNKQKVDVNNDWFVWLDKDLLALKMTYVYHTWLFNQSDNISSSFVTDITGSTFDDKTTEKQKQAQKQIKENYEALTFAEREFAASYDSVFNSSKEPHTKLEEFIKSSDLNKIYNKFIVDKKDIAIFQNHLLSVLKAGNDHDYQETFSLKGEKILLTEDKKPKPVGKKLSISLNKELNIDQTIEKVFDLLLNYSIQGFSMKKSEVKPENIVAVSSTNSDKQKTKSWPSGIYSTIANDRFIESINVTEMPLTQVKTQHLKFLFFFLSIFIFCCGVIVSLLYKVPGLIAFLGLVTSLFITFAILTSFGIHFSFIAFTAFLVLFLFGLANMTSSLNIFRNLLKSGKLIKHSFNIVKGKALVNLIDTSFVFFIFSSFIAMFAPVDFREFGIIISFGILVFLFIIPIFSYCNIYNLVQRFYNNTKLFHSSSFGDNNEETLFDNVALRAFNKAKTYGFLISFFIFIAFVLWMLDWHFNSFLAFKKSYLLIMDTTNENFDSAKTAILGALNNQTIDFPAQTTNKAFYLITSNLNTADLLSNLKTSFSNGYFSLQETFAYSEINSFKDLLSVVYWVFLVVSIYLFARFGFATLLNLWVSTTAFVSFYFSFLLITQFNISNVFNLVFLFLIASIILTNVIFAEAFKFKSKDHFSFNKEEIVLFISNIYKDYKLWWISEFAIISFFLFFALFSSSTPFFFLLQIVMLKLLLLLVFIPLQAFVWMFIQKVKHNYLSSFSKDGSKQTLLEQIFQWDPYDEEVIESINS